MSLLSVSLFTIALLTLALSFAIGGNLGALLILPAVLAVAAFHVIE
jgi:hypothetical protein